jgi:hypothetical protein
MRLLPYYEVAALPVLGGGCFSHEELHPPADSSAAAGLLLIDKLLRPLLLLLPRLLLIDKLLRPLLRPLLRSSSLPAFALDALLHPRAHELAPSVPSLQRVLVAACVRVHADRPVRVLHPRAPKLEPIVLRSPASGEAGACADR